VIRIGFRVLRTSSRMSRHLALNTEIATSFIFCLYHGQPRNDRNLPIVDASCRIDQVQIV
jgi:hypothetical protein